MKVVRLEVCILVAFLLIFCIPLIIPSNSYAASYITFYVDGTNGSDVNDGLSWAKAFRTISKGVSALGSAEVAGLPRQLKIAQGDYTNFDYSGGVNNTENLLKVGGLSGTPQYPIIIQGIGEVNIYGYTKKYGDYNLGEEGYLNRWSVSTHYSIIDGLDAKNIWFENINAIGAKFPVKFEGTEHGSGTYNIVFNNCEFSNATSYVGFFIGFHMHDYYFFNNKWTGNLNPAYPESSHLIYWNAGKNGYENSYNISWVNNEFAFSGRWALHLNAARIYNFAIMRNIFRHNRMGGIQAYQISYSIIENNIFYESGLASLILWMEVNNYWNQVDPDDGPPRPADTVHHVTVRNNTFFKRKDPLYYYHWWNACPGTNQSTCWNYKDETSCVNAPQDCYWFEPANPSQCSSNNVPYGLGCYSDEPRWEGGTQHYPDDQPSIKITIDGSGNGHLFDIVEDFYDVVVENNIISSGVWEAIRWERTNPNCPGCNNRIKNNLIHRLDPDVWPGFNIYKSDTEMDWFSCDTGPMTYPDLIIDNFWGEPKYSSYGFVAHGLVGMWPEDLEDEHNPNADIQEVWLRDYPTFLPNYKDDSRYDYMYNLGSDAIDAASDFYPNVDIENVKRPIGDFADVGPYEFVKDDCPNDPNKTGPGICGCGTPDTDTDLDGTADCIDGCPGDKNKTKPGVCGCGVPDVDNDKDGVIDCLEECPNDPNKTKPGICGCGVADDDSDSDGSYDCQEECPNDPNKTSPGVCGCGIADTDNNNNGVIDCLEDGSGNSSGGNNGNGGGAPSGGEDLTAAKAGAISLLKKWRKALRQLKGKADKAKKVKKARKNALQYFTQTVYMQGTMADAFSLQIRQIKKGTAGALKSKADDIKRKKLCKKTIKMLKVFIGMLS